MTMTMIHGLSESDYELVGELIGAAWHFLRQCKDTSGLMRRLVKVLDFTQFPLPPSEHRSRDLTDGEIAVALDQLEGVREILGATTMSKAKIYKAAYRLWRRLSVMRGRVPCLDDESERALQYEYRVTQKLLDLHEHDTGEPRCTMDELVAWICSKPAEFFRIQR
jgi:hypothetical protein